MTKKYVPNKVPLKVRILFTLTGFGLIIYTINGLAQNSLFVFGTGGRAMDMSGIPMWLVALAFICAASNLLSDVIDHYDKRNNESRYKKFRKITGKLGWVFFIAGLVLQVYLAVRDVQNLSN